MKRNRKTLVSWTESGFIILNMTTLSLFDLINTVANSVGKAGYFRLKVIVIDSAYRVVWICKINEYQGLRIFLSVLI